MKKIKITGGRYGYVSPTGVYSVKTPDDKPFEVEDSEAARLVKRGVAEIIGEGGNAPETGSVSEGKGNALPEDKKPAGGASKDSVEYDENTSVNKLREIGKKYGLSFPVNTKKAEILAALDEYFGRESEKEDGDEDGDVDLGVEPPVV